MTNLIRQEFINLALKITENEKYKGNYLANIAEYMYRSDDKDYAIELLKKAFEYKYSIPVFSRIVDTGLNEIILENLDNMDRFTKSRKEDILFKTGSWLYSNGKKEKAISIINQLDTNEAKNRTYKDIIRSLSYDKNLNEILEIINKNPNLDLLDDNVYSLISYCYIEQNIYNKAIEYINKINRTDTKSNAIHKLVNHILNKKQLQIENIKYIEELLPYYVSNTDNLLNTLINILELFSDKNIRESSYKILKDYIFDK